MTIDTRIPNAPATFKAVTWNVAGGTSNPPTDSDLERLLVDELKAGTTVLLLQELSRRDVRAMLRDHGLRLAFHPRQYGIAYDPRAWGELASGGVRLGATGYYRKGGDTPQYSEAVYAILGDRAGRTLTALSYHTPAHVQVSNPPVRRLEALRESAATMRRLARQAHTTAVLFGGDDNVDEARAFRDRFRFMLKGQLTQVRAPEPTHGHRTRGRRIDDFRVAGELKVLAGSVHPGGGDHRRHRRAFRWTA